MAGSKSAATLGGADECVRRLYTDRADYELRPPRYD